MEKESSVILWQDSLQNKAIVVDPAHQPAVHIEPEQPETPDEPVEPTEPVETLLITTEIAVAIGIAAVAVLASVSFVLLRRRK